MVAVEVVDAAVALAVPAGFAAAAPGDPDAADALAFVGPAC